MRAGAKERITQPKREEMNALQKVTYKPIEFEKDGKPLFWTISIKIGKRRPAILCHQGKPIEFPSSKKAIKYIKENYK